MAETSSATPVISSRRAVEECVELARSNSGQAFQADHTDPADLRASPRIPFPYQIRYCPHSALSEDHTKPAQALDISLGHIYKVVVEAVDGTTVRLTSTAQTGAGYAKTVICTAAVN